MPDRPRGNRIDATWPDAPPGAGPGPEVPGATTLVLDHPSRPLTIELWYPAVPGTPAGGNYHTLLRDGITPVVLHGRAARDAPAQDGPFPLVLLSHGFPGNRLLLSHFGETLASRGFIVASGDHPLSTYADAPADRSTFGDTLVHRPLDQGFALTALLEHPEWGARLAPRAALIGYSMGAYGAMIAGGAGLSAAAPGYPGAPPGLSHHQNARPDPRLKAVVPIGLWGAQHGFWSPETLARWRLPCLMIGGDADEVSGWDPGIGSAFRALRGPDQWLLTFAGAGHNAAAPIPAPEESWRPSPALAFLPAQHYADPVWPTVKMNAAAQAVVLAFLDHHLRQGPDLSVQPDGRPAGFGPDWRGLSLARAG